MSDEVVCKFCGGNSVEYPCRFPSAKHSNKCLLDQYNWAAISEIGELSDEEWNKLSLVPITRDIIYIGTIRPYKKE